MIKNIVKLVLIVFDICLLLGIFFALKFLNITITPDIKTIFIIIIIIILLMQNEQLYNIRYDFWQETYKIFKSLFLSYLIVLFFLFVIEKNTDYLSFITIYFSLIFFLIPISKRLLKYFLFKKLKLIINVSILGNK